ncbi:MAG: gamma-glutamylcyclotransferase [Nitrospinaceae bacterium]|nr:gamma-glutamylcyclotransferase [Nitrospinaceae bacterium]NIR55902.1 gamma-glutamylcyclotransferase [Nitrospinaceae bacterium]NIS86348.1 gamma-glutamylcyclotransferase [Nitrospinaceae bacterium]NIT83184.1 gamma-glutamylcyclotransferase [Nitrospinaceae bacterium]NIU43939.1 gamma-glutamylcyclotransferase [Nitrospinaceae bacterium]
MSDVVNFFAYNELMNEDHFREQGLEFRARSSVTLSAYRLVFNKIPRDNGGLEGLGLANIEPTPSNAGMMYGVLYEIDDSYLPRLDELFGYPKEYVRKVVEITRHDFNLAKAITYIARPEKTEKGLKPSKSMLKIFKGAKKNLNMLYFSKIMTTKTAD